MGIKRSGERVMAGWFNIDYLRDPSFMKSAGGGNGYAAMGDVLSKFGGIINAERDRKYQLEQDKLKNERESKKVESEVNKNNSYVDARTGALGERMKLFKRNKKNSYILSEKDKRWNRFIEDVCFRNLSSLSKIQRKAVICYNYDVEMNNGGFSLYRDCYPAINSTELKEALIEISNEDIANNYM